MTQRLIFLFTLFCCNALHAQPTVHQDSLARYSYLLYGSTVLNHPDNSSVARGQQGTGFFIKRGGDIYFITAKHAISNYVADGEMRNNYPDSFNVYAHYDDPFQYVSIPAMWSTVKVASNGGLNDTDVCTYKVSGKLNGMNINIVELPKAGAKLVSSQNNYDKIRIFGFPEQMNKIQGNLFQITPPYLFETTHFKISENFLNQIGKDIGIDSVRYEVQITDAKITSTFGGFSGAPVFIENKGTGKWELIGVLVGINPLRNAIYVVKNGNVILYFK